MSKPEPVDQIIDPSWSVYAAPLIAILQVAEQLGLSKQQLMKEVGIEASELNIPERRFPVNAYFRLYQAASTAAGDPDLGLKVGRLTFLKGLNLQLYLATVCKSFRDYLNLMPSNVKLRGDIGRVTTHREGDLIELRWEPLLLETGRKRFVTDEMLAASAGIFNSLCVMPVRVMKANFSYSKPQDVSKLEILLVKTSILINRSVVCSFAVRRSVIQCCSRTITRGLIRVIRFEIFLKMKTRPINYFLR